MSPKQIVRLSIEWFRGGCVGLIAAVEHYATVYALADSSRTEALQLAADWLEERISLADLY